MQSFVTLKRATLSRISMLVSVEIYSIHMVLLRLHCLFMSNLNLCLFLIFQRGEIQPLFTTSKWQTYLERFVHNVRVSLEDACLLYVYSAT